MWAREGSWVEGQKEEKTETEGGVDAREGEEGGKVGA